MKNDPCSCYNATYATACKRSLKTFRTSRGFELTHDLAICVQFSNQLSYEATEVGSRSIVGSYVPVKEMSVNDI